MANDKINNGLTELEKRLWAAADQLWANSPLSPPECPTPVLGLILDSACTGGGMFVSSACLVPEHRKTPSSELPVHGVQKNDETGRLCHMNLAVRGLEGDIRHGDNVKSYYDDPRYASASVSV